MASGGMRRLAVLAGAVLGLAACQSAVPAPEPVAVAPPPPKPVRVAQKPVRPKRAEVACKTAAELTAERKEALFRQFAALQDGAPETTLVSQPASAPAASVACRHAAR